MRISTQQIFGRGLSDMQDVNSQLQKTQTQISTGKKILTPADDPYASTKIGQINQRMEENKQFQKNIGLAQNRLEQQDAKLGGINDILQKVREIATQAGNGALNSEDRNSLANELRQRLDQLQGLMNTKDSSGEFIFAGFQGQTTPFVKNETGAYVYQGDEGQRFIQVDTMVSVAINENGKALFMDIPTVTPGVRFQNLPVSAGVSSVEVVDPNAAKQFYSEAFTVTFNDPAAVTPNGPNYTITTANGRVLGQNQEFILGDPIVVNGVEVKLGATPAPNESFNVEITPPPKQGILTTVEKLIQGLEKMAPGEEGQKQLSKVIGETLGNLSNAESTVLNGRSRIGARINTIESTKQLHTDVEVLSKEVLSNLQDLDYAEAVSRMSMESFILQAAQQTYTKVTGLSLFDQLR